MTSEQKPRLRWRRTWPGERDREDFIVEMTGGTFLRIYRTANGAEGSRWFWCAAKGDRRLGSGHVGTAREAALAAEAAFDADP